MDRSKKRIAVIGSGITGLTAAYRMKKIIEKEKLPFELMVLEGSIRSGGNILTMKMGEHHIDVGAASIDAREIGSEASELIDELNLTDKIEYSQNGKPDIFAFNKLYSLDGPTYKGIPAKRGDIWKYDILSFQGKLSYLRNTYLSSNKIKEDQKTSDFLSERLGLEFAEYVAEPFFTRTYSSEVEEMGIRATNEPIFSLEQEYGDLTKAIQEHPELWDGEGNYFTFENGIETLTNALIESLDEHIQLSKKVTEIKKSIEGTYILDINQKEQVRVGTVVVATEPKSYNNLFSDSDLNDYFRDIKMGSIGYVLLGFPKGAVTIHPKGYGLVSPRRNDSYITSVDWLNKKWKYLEDTEDELIGVHFGRGGEDIIMSLSNNQIEEAILKDLEKMLGITDEPLYRLVKRWPNSVPQFTVTHEEKRQELFNHLKENYPGVYLAGNGMDGFGIHSCIQQGEKVSISAINHLKRQNSIF